MLQKPWTLVFEKSQCSDNITYSVSLKELGVTVVPCSALTEALFFSHISALRLMTGIWVL